MGYKGRRKSLVLCLGITAILAACATGTTGRRRPIESISGTDPSITPFRIEVLEELDDGALLLIKGRLITKSEWPSKDVIVRLAALDNNGEQRVSFHKVSDLAPNSAILAAGAATPFSLSLSSMGLSNYQIEVLWGQDAAPFLAKEGVKQGAQGAKLDKDTTKDFLALRNLNVHRVPGESCSSPNECELKFTITGEFFNAGSATVSNVVIVAGFTTAENLDLVDQILDNERRVEVQNLGLKPGGTKQFKFSMEKLVAASDQSAPRPVVRIVSFDSN